jgi:hypothetical protein
MTRDVAEFLAERVFRILPDCPSTDANTAPESWAQYEEIARARVSAGEFGDWVRSLPALLYNNTGATSGIDGANAERPAAIVAAATPDSRRSSLRNAIAAGLTHSPDCVYSQLQEAAGEDEEDEDEVEAMFADKTLAQVDAYQSTLEHDDDDADDCMLHIGATPILPGLIPNTQSSPSTASLIPVSPRFPRTLSF